jgi:hypothetical protein
MWGNNDRQDPTAGKHPHSYHLLNLIDRSECLLLLF